jgi:hypothetical protein
MWGKRFLKLTQTCKKSGWVIVGVMGHYTSLLLMLVILLLQEVEVAEEIMVVVVVRAVTVRRLRGNLLEQTQPLNQSCHWFRVHIR